MSSSEVERFFKIVASVVERESKNNRKLQDSSHPHARDLDKLYNDVLNSPKVCKSCGQIGYLFSPDGVCMGDECETQKEAYKRYCETFKGYDL